MNKFLANLNPRERRWVLGGGALLLALLIYTLGWLPFSREVARLQNIVSEQRALAAWMEQAAREARRLRGLSTGSTENRGRRSLLALADQTAKQAGLGNAIKRVEPEGQDKVHIRLEQAPFDDLTAWLEKLQLGHQVRIVSITIDRQALPGLVDVRLTLEAGGA
ncbi:MAG: type II secretion system protein GspM [Gammaproteobacteria bacterium]